MIAAMQAETTVKVRVLEHAQGLPLPVYATEGAAGADVCAAVAEPMVISPGERVAVPTGLVVEIRAGWEIQVRPRSGLAIRSGLTVVNAPGTIDSDYRGEVKILLVNLGAEAVVVHRGDRVAQLVVAPVTQASFVEAAALGESERGSGGFGSTGR